MADSRVSCQVGREKGRADENTFLAVIREQGTASSVGCSRDGRVRIRMTILDSEAIVRQNCAVESRRTSGGLVQAGSQAVLPTEGRNGVPVSYTSERRSKENY